MLEVSEALELIQIDHTLADVMVFDSVYRRSIGQAWLSRAIDVATRGVLGFHLGLEAPSAFAVAQCIEHAVLPKIRSAAASATEMSWNLYGIPKTILVDNDAEFHGEALTRGAPIQDRPDLPACHKTPIWGTHRTTHRYYDEPNPSPAQQYRFLSNGPGQLLVGECHRCHEGNQGRAAPQRAAAATTRDSPQHCEPHRLQQERDSVGK